MRIAQVLSFDESRPIDFRESRGLVVSYLTEELLRAGHEVSLFAGPEPDASDLAGCDVVHFHLNRAEASAPWRFDVPGLATLHAGGSGRPAGSGALSGLPLVAVSDAQRARLPSLLWSATVPYGIPEHAFRFREGEGGYLAVVGAMFPGEGMDRAIEIARRSGRRLRIAMQTGETDEAYFQSEIAPLLADPHVSLVRGLEDGSRNEFLGDAVALLQLAGRRGNPELTAIEALASGTPVIHCGPFAEQEALAEGTADLAAATVSAAAKAVDRAAQIDRVTCRQVFERRFTAARMANQYLDLYRAVVERSASRRRLPLPQPEKRAVYPEA